MSTNQLSPGKYRHYKGHDYEVIGVAIHTETEEELVVYRQLYGAGGLCALARIEATEYSARMKTVTLTAHVSGDIIQLDEPFALPANARLLVTILPESLPDAERQQWYALSKAGLARAYSDDEPDYPASLVRTHAVK